MRYAIQKINTMGQHYYYADETAALSNKKLVTIHAIVTKKL